MKTYIYRGGFPIVEKSGVGKAIEHQEKMLNAVEHRVQPGGKKQPWFI